MRAIEKCRVEGSKEMRKGGDVRQNLNGQIVTLTIPDQRNVYMESVESLYDLLEYFFDEEATKNINELDEQIKTSHLFFLNKIKDLEKNVREKQIIESGIFPQSIMGNGMKHQWIENKVLFYRKKFRLLFSLFKRKNELSSKRTLGYA